jgi:selenide, water dikinase
MNAPETLPTHPVPRLTSLSHGGGCGCKIAPGVLSELLKHSAPGLVPAALLVGTETADDAAVYRINDSQAIVATTDFFMPIVDDPFDFGAIAATNAISDIYAMGATPLFALALVGMPITQLPLETIRRVLEGGEAKCREAGIPVAGGHSIDSVEPIYGLVVIGLVDPRKLKRNVGARAGDMLILGKPLGVGIYSAALKKERLAPTLYDVMLASTTKLNTPGVALGAMDGVHALTDVTGFGLAGHLLELCRGSKQGATLVWSQVPLHPDVLALARAGMVTGASARNWAGYGAEVDLDPRLAPEVQALLSDPQTSGGLLVACEPPATAAVIDCFRREGFASAAVIGHVDGGAPRVSVQL